MAEKRSLLDFQMGTKFVNRISFHLKKALQLKTSQK